MSVLAWFASAVAATNPLLTQAWTAESDKSSGRFGSVSSAGDVNGDGYADVIVGAAGYERAFLYLGTATGLETTAAWSAESDVKPSQFGFSVSAAGDVNGDGYGDVVVGAVSYSDGEFAEGRAFLYLGSASGLETTEAWTAESDQSSSWFGFVSSAGDVNADGFADVIVGAKFYDGVQSDEGRAYLYLGSATGLDTTAAWTASSGEADGTFGVSVSSAGDVNGDGYDDVVIGASGAGTTGEGSAYVYLGSASGLEQTAEWTVDGDGGLGYSVSSAGDVNGDGYDNVVVGASGGGEVGQGSAYLYFGSASGLEQTAASTLHGDQGGAFYGWSVSSAGDVNHDGYSDVLVGAVQYENGEPGEGRAYAYLGSASGLSTTAAWTAESDQDSAWFGFVSPAGDVNADGFADVIIGAKYYDGGEIDEGRAYLYLGGCPEGALGTFADSDGDFITDACDLCPGFDDFMDVDLDSVPDGCDCPVAGQDEPLDLDGDGVLGCTGDCDDDDPTSYPGAPQLCDGRDNACTGAVPVDELDADADGFLACADDCDDDDPMASPASIEVCGDGVDNDCDGAADQECGADPTVGAGGCDCAEPGVPGGAPLVVLAILATMARRRRRP